MSSSPLPSTDSHYQHLHLHSVAASSQPGHIDTQHAVQPQHNTATGGPWCQECRPHAQILLAQCAASVAGQTDSAPWAFSSPFPDYICFPALIHRSQLALLAPSFIVPASPTSPTPTEQSTSAATVTATGTPAAAPTASTTPVRRARGVKIACTNCRVANKKCDEGRPCLRCSKSGLQCISAERKKRKRMVRRTASVSMAVPAQADAIDTPIAPGAPHSISVRIATSTSYVGDSQEMADAANNSSPSDDSALADFDMQLPPDTHNIDHVHIQVPAGDMQVPPNYLFTNFWSPSQAHLTSDQHFFGSGFGGPLFAAADVFEHGNADSDGGMSSARGGGPGAAFPSAGQPF